MHVWRTPRGDTPTCTIHSIAAQLSPLLRRVHCAPTGAGACLSQPSCSQSRTSMIRCAQVSVQPGQAAQRHRRRVIHQRPRQLGLRFQRPLRSLRSLCIGLAIKMCMSAMSTDQRSMGL